MNNWVLLEHKVFSDASLDVHYDFLVENEVDCLTWKFFKIPLLNQASVEIIKQQNHRLVWLSRKEYELSENRGFVKRIDNGIFQKVADKLNSECSRFILDGKVLCGLLEISGNSCRLIKNN